MNASQRRVGIMGLGRLVNVGQGAHVVEQDLLAALNEVVWVARCWMSLRMNLRLPIALS
jgi:phosphoglycerate dehydrogenase-like enzyme